MMNAHRKISMALFSLVVSVSFASVKRDSIFSMGNLDSSPPRFLEIIRTEPNLSLVRSVDKNKTVGQIRYNEGVTPVGSKFFEVPIYTRDGIGFSPAIKLHYDSHIHRGSAGVGWDLSGISKIEIANTNIHYHQAVFAPNLSDINTKGEIPYDGNGNFDPTLKDFSLGYMHEYGHYIRSQQFGSLYLFMFGLPSFGRSMFGGSKNFYTETDANYEVARYFMKHEGLQGWPENSNYRVDNFF